jgi:glutamate racemase
MTEGAGAMQGARMTDYLCGFSGPPAAERLQSAQSLRARLADKPQDADRPRSPIDFVLSSMDARGLSKFYTPGGAEKAAEAMALKERVLLLTGFNVMQGTPETDGPIGTAVLAKACVDLGMEVTIATDAVNAPVMNAVCKVLDPTGTLINLEIFDAQRDNPEAAAAQAAQLLGKVNPDTVIAIELPSRTQEDPAEGDASGMPKNMRGINIGPDNAAVDAIMIEARKNPDILTIGCLDGGNEVGSGGLKGVPLAKDGVTPMQGAVGVDIPVAGWNSNLAAEAIAAILYQYADRLDEFPSAETLTTMIETALQEGAVDGVTRGSVAGAPNEMADQGWLTGVDGFAPVVHEGMRNMLVQAVRTAIEPLQFVVGFHDSGNGALVAMDRCAEEIAANLPYNVRFVATTDQGVQNYGSLPDQEITRRTNTALRTLDRAGPDVDLIVCNTASAKLPDAGTDVQTPVENLIRNTVPAIMEHGGCCPYIFCTVSMANTGMYEELIRQQWGVEKPGKEVHPHAIAAPGWADIVNSLDHLDPAKREAVQEIVDQYVVQMKRHAEFTGRAPTSLILGCTHYPAFHESAETGPRETHTFQSYLRESLDKHGMPDVEIINPMAYQARAAVRHLRDNADLSKHDVRIRSHQPIVISTGSDPERMQRSAEALMGSAISKGDPIVLMSPGEFRPEHAFEMIGALMFKPQHLEALRQEQATDFNGLTGWQPPVGVGAGAQGGNGTSGAQPSH